jgi:hypothetical protein
MMRGLLTGLALLFLSVVGAQAQGCGNNNPNCIVPTAPLNTNNQQAASTAWVWNQFGSSGSFAPNFPVIHPTLTQSGCAPTHSILWADNNWCLNSDEIAFTSTDPSALLSFAPTGTPSAGTKSDQCCCRVSHRYPSQWQPLQ